MAVQMTLNVRLDCGAAPICYIARVCATSQSSPPQSTTQQHVARLVDPGSEPVGAAVVWMRGPHQPVMRGADVRLAGPRLEAKHLIRLLARHRTRPARRPALSRAALA